MSRCHHNRDEDNCLACYAEDVLVATAERRYETLAEALARLEGEDDDVRAARLNLDHTMWRMTRSSHWRDTGRTA